MSHPEFDQYGGSYEVVLDGRSSFSERGVSTMIMRSGTDAMLN